VKVAVVHMPVFGEGVGFSLFFFIVHEAFESFGLILNVKQRKFMNDQVNCFTGKQSIGYRALHRFPHNVKEEQL